MVRYLIDENQLRLSDHDSEHDEGVTLIVALICGDTETCNTIIGDEEMFLTELVNNKFCLIDVDKWDYLLRDGQNVSHILPIRADFHKCFLNAKVVKTEDDGLTHIAFQRSDYNNIIDLFENRANLHLNVYQSPEVIAVELLLERIFMAADESGFLLKGWVVWFKYNCWLQYLIFQNRSRIAEAQSKLRVFSYLDDTITQTIDISDDQRHTKAQSLIRILKEKKYHVIYNKSIDEVKVGLTHSKHNF